MYVSTENPNWAKNRKPINQSKFEMFKNLRNMGLTLKDIADKLDIKYGTIFSWNYKYISKGVKAEPLVPRQKDLAFEKFKELNAQGYCAKDIADRVGYTRNRIYKWRKLLQHNNEA